MSGLFPGTRQAAYLIGVPIRPKSRLEGLIAGKDTGGQGGSLLEIPS
jgi:hypothetical protein